MSFSDCTDYDGHVIIVALLAAIAGTAPVLDPGRNRPTASKVAFLSFCQQLLGSP